MLACTVVLTFGAPHILLCVVTTAISANHMREVAKAAVTTVSAQVRVHAVLLSGMARVHAVLLSGMARVYAVLLSGMAIEIAVETSGCGDRGWKMVDQLPGSDVTRKRTQQFERGALHWSKTERKVPSAKHAKHYTARSIEVAVKAIPVLHLQRSLLASVTEFACEMYAPK